MKPHADLQAFQFCSACAQSSEMGPRLGMFDLFQSVFFGHWSRCVRFPDLTDSQPCWLEAEPSDVRAEQSWLEDEGVLMDRTAREAALIRK